MLNIKVCSSLKLYSLIQIPGNFNMIDGFEGYVLNMYTVPE